MEFSYAPPEPHTDAESLLRLLMLQSAGYAAVFSPEIVKDKATGHKIVQPADLVLTTPGAAFLLFFGLNRRRGRGHNLKQAAKSLNVLRSGATLRGTSTLGDLSLQIDQYEVAIVSISHDRYPAEFLYKESQDLRVSAAVNLPLDVVRAFAMAGGSSSDLAAFIGGLQKLNKPVPMTCPQFLYHLL